MPEDNLPEKKNQRRKEMNRSDTAGFVYVLTIIGAAIYFIQHSATFWGGVLGFLKALIWPLLMIYKVLDILKM